MKSVTYCRVMTIRKENQYRYLKYVFAWYQPLGEKLCVPEFLMNNNRQEKILLVDLCFCGSVC